MTRKEIEAEYRIENGTILSPGKFEGEAIYAPHFSEFASDGEILETMEDGSGAFVALVEIEAEDRAAFPEIEDGEFALVTENSDGFVMVSVISAAKADSLRAMVTREDDGEED